MKNTELCTLEELVKIQTNPSERERFYSRLSLIFYVFGVIVALLSPVVVEYLSLKSFYGVSGGIIAGLLLGFGVYYKSAKKQVPYFTEYISLDISKVKCRISELQNSPKAGD